MRKIREIKEIKSSVKVIREVKPAEEEIQELTAEEVPFSEQGITQAVAPVLEVDVGGESIARPVPFVERGVGVREQLTEEEEISGRVLYDVGKSMGGEARQKYVPTENVQGPTMRSVSVGSDFAMGGGGGSYPEAQHIENKLRTDAVDSRDEYHSRKMEGQSGEKRRRYPWET